MARTPKVVSATEILQQLTEGIKRTAINPTIAAYKPLPHQERFHKSQKRGKLFIGGNRSGKTVGGGAESVWWLTGRHPYRKDIPQPPVYGRIVAVDIDEGIEKITKPEIKRWMPPSLLKNGSWEDSFNKQLRTLYLENGSFVEFMSYEQDVQKFSGVSRHFTWFDEEPPKDIFNECKMRLADLDGSWWITMTPLIEMSFTYDEIYEPAMNGQEPGYDIFEVATSENTYIKEEALEFALKGLDEGEKEARKLGRYIHHTGLVYKFTSENLIDDIITSDNWEEYRKKWGHFCMLDAGIANPTVFLFGCFDNEGRIIIYDEIYQSGKTVRENALDFARRREELKVPVQYTVADPSIKNRDPITGTSVLQEYADYGIYLSLANNDLRGGLSRVQNRFERKLLFISERCEKTLWEIVRYRWDRYASSKIAQRKNPKEMPMKKDDHAMDAMRYGVASRPALDNEVDMKFENVLMLPESLGADTDYSWALILGNQKKEANEYDEHVGLY